MNTERENRIALLLRAIEDSDRELAEYKTGWKDRRTKLENDLSAIKYEILTGQKTLFAGGNGNGQAESTGKTEGQLPDQPHP